MLALFLSSVAGAQDPNLLGWWTLDESSGTIAHDSSGNANDGVFVSAPQWASGYAGGAAWFDGVDDFIEVPHSDSLLPGAEVTIMAWINTPRHTGAGGSGWQALITKGNAPRVYSMYTTPAETGGGGVLHFSIGPEGSFNGTTSTGRVPLNEWVHVCAMVINGGQLYYINGERYEPADGGGSGTEIPPGNTATVRIANAPENNSFAGKMDDVRVYNGALSQETIRLIMVSGLSAAATRPNPDNGTRDVPRDTLLGWKEGRYSVARNVYFGTDFNDVNEAGPSDPRGVLLAEGLTDISFDPAGAGLLEYDTAYYWRVDEINDSNPQSPWRGAVWSFRTANFIVVDDFEGYNDEEPYRVFDAWKDGWQTQTNGGTIGYSEPDFANDEHYVELSIVHSGKQSTPFFYDNNGVYSEAFVPLSGTASDWTRDGVATLSLWLRGYPAYVGGFVEEPAGTYTGTATGADIYGNADEFHFVYKEVTGAATIIAKVESMDNLNDFVKAGIMIRDSLDADSANAALLLTPGNGVRFQYRMTAGSATEREFDPNVAAPYWLKLNRTAGGLVRAYYSPDGATWTQFTLKAPTMKAPVYVGLALTSHDARATCQAKFSNVSFPTTTVPAGWKDQDIGIISNSPEPMYVILSGTTVIYHDLPNTSQIRDWTLWEVPLQEFADLGENLSQVGSFGIGFGNRDDPQPGGKGTMYFDDIRLYRPPAAGQ
ncbi:MAG: hypothetical protein A2Y77_03650 [Planctomycetes bacterium RBG_13_62_9]|nr:MAG: hypothetical protein A2Y77_03650 [Planctomycetes bacterium RBG_13_62_9]